MITATASAIARSAARVRRFRRRMGLDGTEVVARGNRMSFLALHR
jgi:hypothetical protein